MSSPKVSIIIPVYNTEKYLRECLDSVVNQTFRDIEIICINDGSTDCSFAILREYEAKDSRLKAIDKKMRDQPKHVILDLILRKENTFFLLIPMILLM
jgi:glycosyltransferase involved in cell wall biosynthesis